MNLAHRPGCGPPVSRDSTCPPLMPALSPLESLLVEYSRTLGVLCLEVSAASRPQCHHLRAGDILPISPQMSLTPRLAIHIAYAAMSCTF
jgi:hypothetical protein